jgi:hypothetical protein
MTLVVAAGLLLGCAVDRPTAVIAEDDRPVFAGVAGAYDVPKVTGEVEIEWKGGNGRQFPPEEAKLAFAEFDGFQMTENGQAARGSFVFRVFNPAPTPDEEMTLHREIVAEASGVVIDLVQRKAWMIAQVIADTKQCSSGGGCDGHDGGTGGSGGPGGCTDCGGDTGHDGGCSGHDDGTHDDGGCSGSDGGTHDDGGCAGGGTGGMEGGTDGMDGGTGAIDGGTGGTEGGCAGSDGTTHTDGGCSGSDGTTHTDGGCSGSDGTTHTDGGCSGSDGTSHDGGCSGSGGGGPGIHVSGSGSRVGQVLAIKLHDGGTPGTDGDGITWKWFSGEDPELPQITDRASWPHLCKKMILEGNLMIHDPPLP